MSEDETALDRCIGRDAHPRTSSSSHSAGTIITRIEVLLESIIDRLTRAEELTVELLSPRSTRQSPRPELIRFPGRTLQEANKFARVLLILQLSHSALVSGNVLTKRHIYYQHQELFEKQSRVDATVDDLALTLGVGRHDLNIVAAAKGTMCGPVIVQLTHDTGLDASSVEMGVPIPLVRSISSLDMSHVRWVLVIEKDATFRSLTSSNFATTSQVGPGLLITAKGYPDLITLSFLDHIAETYPRLPILCLVDFDPDGLNIFRCYHRGALHAEPRGASRSPGIRLLGIKSPQILELGSDVSRCQPDEEQLSSQMESSQAISSTACREPISQLSLRDRKIALSTLRKVSDSQDDLGEVKRELQVMLMVGIKVEMQWLDESGDMSGWLDEHVGRALSGI